MRKGPFAPKRGRKPNLKRLAAELSYEELAYDDAGEVVDLGAETRASALAAIEELGDPEAFDLAAERLEDPMPQVREAAVRAVAALDSARARDLLIDGVISWPAPYADARTEALRTLLQLDDESVPARVVQAVAASNGSTRLDGITRSAIVHLASDSEQGMGPDQTVALLIDMVRRREGSPRNLEVLLAWLGDVAVDELVDGLQEPELRESAAIVLGAMRESRAVPGLVECLEDDRPDVRLASARALGEIRDVRGVEGLLRAVSDPDFEVRKQSQEALDALGTVGVVAGVSAVLQMAISKAPEQLTKPAEDGQ